MNDLSNLNAYEQHAILDRANTGHPNAVFPICVDLAHLKRLQALISRPARRAWRAARK